MVHGGPNLGKPPGAKLDEVMVAALPYLKVGGCRRIRASDLRHFIAQLSATT